MTARTALVTGSTAGLGLAIAAALGRAGYQVMLHGLLPPEEGGAIATSLAAEIGEPIAYECADLAAPDGTAALINASLDRFGGVDVLVNNAVVRHFAPIESFPIEAWDRALAVNLSASFHTIRLCLPGMRARGWGRIVNMASVYGQRGANGRVDYVATKAAILGLTRAVAAETSGSAVTCNAVCPGSVSTPGTEARVSAIARDAGVDRDEAIRQFLAGKQPSGRFVSADSVAAMVVFLCGPAGDDITGAVLPVEGGWLAV